MLHSRVCIKANMAQIHLDLQSHFYEDWASLTDVPVMDHFTIRPSMDTLSKAHMCSHDTDFAQTYSSFRFTLKYDIKRASFKSPKAIGCIFHSCFFGTKTNTFFEYIVGRRHQDSTIHSQDQMTMGFPS